MAPRTRSGGAPAPDRVYHSSPAARQQAQFPARIKRVRKHSHAQHNHPPGLKQQTLTQINFLSIFNEHDIMASFNSDESESHGPFSGEDRSTAKQRTRGRARKRRRIEIPPGNGTESRDGDGSQARRRRTLGEQIFPSSRYHTQTLTQVLGRQRSQSEASSASPPGREHEPEGTRPCAGCCSGSYGSHVKAARRSSQGSVIAHTPPRPPSPEEPPGIPSPSMLMVGRYGPPGRDRSPCTLTRPSVSGSTDGDSPPRCSDSPDEIPDSDEDQDLLDEGGGDSRSSGVTEDNDAEGHGADLETQAVINGRSSQATTASRPSTPELHSSAIPDKNMVPPDQATGSTSTIRFLDEGNSSIAMPFPSSLSSATQLLSQSQMLSESLLRDHQGPPEEPEIWDSEDDEQ